MRPPYRFLTGHPNAGCAIVFIVMALATLAFSRPVEEVRVVVGGDAAPVVPRYDPNTCFDKVWRIINDDFWDPNFNGVDWEDSRRRYKPKALAATGHESFAAIVNEMLAELKTSHTKYLTKWDPDYYTIQAVFKTRSLEYWGKGNPHRTGIGVVTKEIDDRHYAIAVLRASAAEKAGIVLGDWLVAVDGEAFHPIRSFENKAGQEVELTIQRGPSESTRQVVKVRPVETNERELFENDSLATIDTIEHKGRSFAYVRLWWIAGWTMKHVLEWGMNRAYTADGIIIDIRDGFGGDTGYEYIAPFLGYGLPELTVESTGRQRTFTLTPGFQKPVVVLINRGSRSGKELLAYCFKKTKRAVLVGERTAGYVTGGRWKRISEDSILYYCVGMMTVDDKRLEGVGVEPDVTVPFDIRFAGGKDIQLAAAKDEMVRLIGGPAPKN